jgi:hypothetical protein
MRASASGAMHSNVVAHVIITEHLFSFDLALDPMSRHRAAEQNHFGHSADYYPLSWEGLT